MISRVPSGAHKPRELRRRVIVPARLRMGAFWTDARILNISSRGLMIQSSRAAQQDCLVELWKGDRVIVARVVWRKGVKAGLQSEERVPIEEIVSLAQSPGLQLTPRGRPAYERRRRPRTNRNSRLRARALEFASVAIIGASLAGAAFGLIEQALGRPFAAAQSAPVVSR